MKNSIDAGLASALGLDLGVLREAGVVFAPGEDEPAEYAQLRAAGFDMHTLEAAGVVEARSETVKAIREAEAAAPAPRSRFEAIREARALGVEPGARKAPASKEAIDALFAAGMPPLFPEMTQRLIDRSESWRRAHGLGHA